MPQIIKPFGGDSMGQDLFGIGGLTEAFFGPKASTAAYTREKFREQQRQNQYTPLLADRVRQLGLPGGDLNQTLGDTIMAGVPVNEITAANLAATTNANPNSLGSNVVTAASMGAKVPYGSTVAGTNADMAMRREVELGKTDRLVRAQAEKDASELIQIIDLTKPQGYSSVTKAEVLANPGKYQQLQGLDLTKAALAGPAYQTGFGGLNEPQKAFVGVGPKDQKGENFYITNALGEVVDQGVSEDSGRSRIDGTPVVLKPGEKLGLASSANPTAISGLGTPGAAIKDIRESRVATRTATAQIDNTIAALNKPNAHAALGLVGQGAVMVNNLRSQVDALTGTARELGYGAHADLFAAGAKDMLAKNPTLLAWAGQNAEQQGILQSQISSLGYVIARANNQGGTLGVRDVEDAMREIGANMHDPKAFAAVLANVKSRLIQQQEIREGVTRETVSPATANALKLGAPAAAPAAAPGAGAAPGGTTATGATWSVKPSVPVGP